ncbi:hypothetical protein BOX15_Mlig034560g1 [Macrostomum lignano]|uniref:Uncharacterized protein n=1 Tax=Macrostomum lignano TaxID=282301 RepID=A0A267EYI3_9PLAT|nr:hypothetical protein BOX15_Mlig034560g1 [Macrostomum lignano]
MQQGTFEHWYLSKAFLCFEAMINWKPRKHSRIVRKLDSDIRVVDESIEGILKLAAIFIELRQTTKARKLIDQALKLNKLPADTEIVCKTYFTAYAMYLNGLIDFEETCPLASKLNAGSRLLDREKLMKAYRSAKKHLRECLKNLTEEISELGLTASAYTLMGIVCVNEAADFTMEHEGGLYYLEKAVSLESKFETNTIMAANMIQILQQGTTLATTQAARDKCRELYFTIVTTREPETIRSQVDVPTDVEASSQSDSVFNVVAKAREFTDGYREGSLAYWKKELNNILDRSQILHRLVFLLFLSRHNLRSYFLRKAECRQAKVSRLISLAFGLKLETNGSFSFKAMSESFPRHCRELIFVVAFWTVNEGMLALGNALEYYQQKSAAEVRQRWDDGDESFASQLVSWALYSFRLSNKKSNDWKRAQECFRRGQDLFNAIRNSWKSDEIPALIFLENYLAEGFYRLNDVVAFDDRYKTDKKLITTTVDLLQDLNRLKRLEKSHNGPGIETLLSYLNSVCVNFPALLNRLLNQSAGRRNRRLHGGLVSSLLESTGILETFDFIIDTSQASDKLKQLDEAYVLCQKRGLMDTVAHALVHMQAGLQLLRYGEVNPFKPHYDSFSAAILKFRKAARILELICGDDVKVTYCYTVLSVLYSSQMQIDEQESRCLQCLRKCARIESNLIVKEASPSPWLWKCLDVARIRREQFRMLRQNTNDEDALIEREWQSIFDKLFALLGRKTLMCQMPVDIDDASNSETMLAETLSDALVDWEEKRTVSMKGLTNLFRDRQFPEDCLPSDGEIRVYATYLNKLFSQHWELCHNGDNRDCPLEKLDVERNHFLLGISEYSRKSVKEKNKIFTRLQRNHNLLLNECKFAKRFHYKFANF